MTEGKSVTQTSTPELADGDGSAPTLKAGEPQPASDPSSQAGPPVRRSSLRPAPADYRPSARDPSTMRPMAVVRAGDAEPGPLKGDIAAPPPSQPSQPSVVRAKRAEPFALAEDYSANETGDRKTPIMVPPPPAVPIDLIQKPHHLADAAEPERAMQARKTAAEATADTGHELASDSVSADTCSLNQQVTSQSRTVKESGNLNRRKYSLVAVGIASVVLVGAVLAVMNGGNHNAAGPSARLQAHAEPALQQPAVPKLIDALPVAHESNRPAPQQPPAAQSAPIPPTASAPPAASAPLDTTRVTLDLAPIDAKVNYLGRDVPGPPFEFEIAKGQRIAVEVSRFGFATAKVVLDDKKPVVHFGMLRERRAKNH
jgi:hypothetical protein